MAGWDELDDILGTRLTGAGSSSLNPGPGPRRNPWSVLDDLVGPPGEWEEVSPILQRRRKADGSYEFRSTPHAYAPGTQDDLSRPASDAARDRLPAPPDPDAPGLDPRKADLRRRLQAIRATGDVGTVDPDPGRRHGFFEPHGRAEMSPAAAYLTDTVADRGFGWAVGGLERMGVLDEGTRAALRENQAESTDRYLTANPEGGIGRATLLAAGDVAAGIAGPQAILGPGTGALTSRLATTAGAAPTLARAAGFAGGAAEGAIQGYLDAPDLTADERLRQVLTGAGLGGLGAARATLLDASPAPLSPRPLDPDIAQLRNESLRIGNPIVDRIAGIVEPRNSFADAAVSPDVERFVLDSEGRIHLPESRELSGNDVPVTVRADGSVVFPVDQATPAQMGTVTAMETFIDDVFRRRRHEGYRTGNQGGLDLPAPVPGTPAPNPHKVKRIEPLPLPAIVDMGRELTPETRSAIADSWAVVSSRYPTLASRVRAINYDSRVESAGYVKGGPGGGMIVVGRNGLTPEALAHELTHLAQDLRGKLDVGQAATNPAAASAAEIDTLARAETYASRTGRAMSRSRAQTSPPVDYSTYRTPDLFSELRRLDPAGDMESGFRRASVEDALLLRVDDLADTELVSLAERFYTRALGQAKQGYPGYSGLRTLSLEIASRNAREPLGSSSTIRLPENIKRYLTGVQRGWIDTAGNRIRQSDRASGVGDTGVGIQSQGPARIEAVRARLALTEGGQTPDAFAGSTAGLSTATTPTATPAPVLDLPSAAGLESELVAERARIEVEVDQALAAAEFAGRPATPEQAAQFRAARLAAFDREYHARVAEAAKGSGDPTLHDLADRSEPAPRDVVAPPSRPDQTPDPAFDPNNPLGPGLQAFIRARGLDPGDLDAHQVTELRRLYRYSQDPNEARLEGRDPVTGRRLAREVRGPAEGGIGPGNRFKPSEAGFITLPSRARTPDPDPMAALIQYDDLPREPVKVRLRRAVDRFIDQMSDKEDAPIRFLRRKGLGEQSQTFEKYIGRARGASRIAQLPIFNGVYRFDPVTGNTTRVHDSLNSIIGGLDGKAERDLNNYMAARHHLELVTRRDKAQLEYDMARAARLEELRQSRQFDKEQLRSMSGGIRDARARELQAARRQARAAGQAQARTSAARVIAGQAEKVGARADRLDVEAARAARAALDTGFDAAKAEFIVASQYARRLLRDELRGAAEVIEDRPGSTAGLTTGRAGRQPRSPAAVAAMENQGQALSRVARRMGLDEERVRRLLAGSREMGAVSRGLERASWGQAEAAGNAYAREVEAGIEAAGARGVTNRAISGAQRVAMGIRDQAVGLRRRLPPVEPHPDVRLKIDDGATDQARKLIADIESRYGVTVDPATGTRRVNTLDDIASRIRSWSTAAVIDQLDSVGYFKPGQRASLLAAGQEYAPFFRIIDEVAEDPDIVRAATGGGTASPIKRISGGLSTSSKIAPPLESFIEQSQRVAVWVERQRVRNLLGDYAEAFPEVAAEIKRNTPGTRGAGEGFQVFRGGERIVYSAPADVLRSLEGATPQQAGYFMQAGIAAARLLRAGATLTPDFAIRNFLRDQVAATAYGVEFKYRPFADFMTGLWAQLPGSSADLKNFVTQWEASGGALSDYISIERPRLQLATRQARSTSRLARTVAEWKAEKNIFAKVMFPVLRPLEAVSGAVEQATRIGAYRRAKLGGTSDLDASHYSRNITLDFGRSGSLAQRWNSVEAFANASLQDVARFSRAMRERPISTTIAALSTITVPTLAAWAVNRDDPDYDTLPEWEKAAFIHVGKQDDGRWIRIPRPQGMLNLLFGYGVQQMFEAARGDHDEPVTQLLATLFHETPLRFSPVQPDPGPGGAVEGSWEALPSVAQPAVEAIANWSSHQRRPIVPAGMQDVLPEDQAADTTTQLAREIGQRLQVAPLKVDHLIRGYGAGLTASTLRAAEKVAGAGADRPGALPEMPATAKDIPGVGGLVSSSSWGFASAPVQDLYALQSAAAQAKESLELAAEQGRVFDYQRITREHPEFLVADDLTRARRELKDIRDQLIEVRRMPGMDADVRADWIVQLEQMATQIAAANMHQASDVLRGYRESRARAEEAKKQARSRRDSQGRNPGGR